MTSHENYCTCWRRQSQHPFFAPANRSGTIDKHNRAIHQNGNISFPLDCIGIFVVAASRKTLEHPRSGNKSERFQYAKSPSASRGRGAISRRTPCASHRKGSAAVMPLLRRFPLRRVFMLILLLIETFHIPMKKIVLCIKKR